MTLICVIVFIVFMALHKPAKAQAPTPAQGTMVARNQRMAGGQMMDAFVEYRNDQSDEQENDRLDHLFCELRGLREDLRFLRMLSISQGRRIEDIMEQFGPKPSALAKIARYSVAAALAVAALLVTIIGLAYGPL
jgi:hypothetical protein